MLRPVVYGKAMHYQDCYTYVVAVAKRAREIANEAEEQHLILEKKPVQMAVEEFASGMFSLVKTYQPE